MITILLYLWVLIKKGKIRLSHSEELIKSIREIFDDFKGSDDSSNSGLDYASFHNAFVVPYLSTWKVDEVTALLNKKRGSNISWNSFEGQLRSVVGVYPETKTVKELLKIVFQEHLFVEVEQTTKGKVESRSTQNKEEEHKQGAEKSQAEQKIQDDTKTKTTEIVKKEEQKGKVETEIVEDREKDVIVLDDIAADNNSTKDREKEENKTIGGTPSPSKDSKTEVVKTKEKEVVPPTKDEKEKAKVEEVKLTPKDTKETSDKHVPEVVEKKDVLYHVTVKTGDKFNAGTDANVFICLIGEKNDTGKVVLRAQDCDRDKLFEKDAEDHFTVRAVNVGEVKGIRIGHDNKDGFAGWFLDWVTVQAQDYHLVFKADRWLDEDEGDKKLEVELTPEKVIQAAQKRIYSIVVKTGDIKYGGTDAKVFVILTGQQGTTNKIFLKHSKTHKDPFDRNQVDHFIVEEMNVGDISKMRIGHDGKRSGAGWFLDHVLIEATGFDHKWSFSANRWLDKKEADGQLEVDINANKVKL